MKAKLLLILFGTILVTTCNNSSNTNSAIPDNLPYLIELEKSIIDPTSVILSTIGIDLEFVALETNPLCLIKSIDQIVFNDSSIFISDYNNLFQFSRNGSFIKKIGANGRGPGEYNMIRDFCIDNEENNIYIHSALERKILVFNFEGNFIRSFSSPGLTGQIIIKNENSLMFHLANISMPSSGSRYSWYITDKNGKVQSAIKNSLIRQNIPGFSTYESPLYEHKGKIHFMEYGIDTLYYFNDSDQKPYAIFNLGELKMEPDPLLNNKLAVEMVNNKFWVQSVIEDNDNLFIKLNIGVSSSTINCFYNKQSQKVYFLKNNLFINDLCGEIPFWPKYIYQDSILVDYVDAFQMMGFLDNFLTDKIKESEIDKLNRIKILRNQLKETSNPVLMILN